MLVVDDETNLRRLLRGYLQKGGFTVVEAASGLDALSLLRTEEIDVTLIDVMLPGIDGTRAMTSSTGASSRRVCGDWRASLASTTLRSSTS